MQIIQKILFENGEEVKKIDANLYKYVSRIQFFKDSSLEDYFTPNMNTFQYEVLNTKKTLTENEFKESLQYALFQDIEIKEYEAKTMDLEKWQHCLIQILLKIDINSYSSALNMEKEDNLLELFKQIYKTPIRFVVDLLDAEHVKIISYFLDKHFQEKKKLNVIKDLKMLQNDFQEVNKELSIQYDKIERTL